ncbi:hypothetical protein BGX23_001092 [Mortierella sp. AD031]|nr:hypothetical protein BGX23_001092 [Mortierella sp. AD031]
MTALPTAVNILSRPTRPTPPLALTLPEILEQVFAYLTPHKQRFLVGQVCHQWRTVALRLLSATDDDDYQPSTSPSSSSAAAAAVTEEGAAAAGDALVTCDPLTGIVRLRLGSNIDDFQALWKTVVGRRRCTLAFARCSVDIDNIQRARIPGAQPYFRADLDLLMARWGIVFTCMEKAAALQIVAAGGGREEGTGQEDDPRYREACLQRTAAFLAAATGGGWEELEGGPGYRIKELRFEEDSFKDWMMVRLVTWVLSISSTVKTVRIEPTYHWDLLRLLPVLDALPVLEELYVEPRQGYRTVWYGPPRVHFFDQEEEDQLLTAAATTTTRTTRLRVMVLHGAVVSLPALEALVRRCPLVEVLKFAAILNITRATRKSEYVDQSPFIRRIRDLCPRLREFHFSRLGMALKAPEIEAFQSALQVRPTVEIATTSSLSPSRQHIWGFTTQELVPLWKHIQSVKGDWLTGLRFDRIQQGTISPDTNILHKILCACPNLVYVSAQSIYFYHEDMDVNNLLSIDGGYRKVNESPLSSEYPSWRRFGGTSAESASPRRAWACRNLRTLHLSVTAQGMDHRSREFSLVMFGYLSLVCPRLEELKLNREFLHLDDESGLCLLGRLRYLERVEIQTILSSKNQDVVWMRRTVDGIGHFIGKGKDGQRNNEATRDTLHDRLLLSPRHPLLDRCLAALAITIPTRYLKKLPPLSVFQEKKTLLTEDSVDLSGVGCPDDLVLWIRETNKDQDWSRFCLPLLDSFVFRHGSDGHKLTLEAKKLMRSQRPEVDFRVEITDYES